ncbi:Uncharacterised protein [Sphingobacterium multivorum]|uniref:Uncharacterized protein n=1 Tax=Sphingobacterium multivorum TaxID=28454 RepID=A0A2X2LHB5_SPHMU|nr:Uncharacterised protein [Sphingobacterium multivorum]SUJ88756.1 Uncharacterised protein [Sphingobacterium multivorum]
MRLMPETCLATTIGAIEVMYSTIHNFWGTFNRFHFLKKSCRAKNTDPPQVGTVFFAESRALEILIFSNF